MKFLELWDLSGYSERTMSKRPTCPKMSISGQIVSEVVMFNVLKFTRVCMEFSKHNWATISRLRRKLVDYCPEQGDYKQRTFKDRNKQSGSKCTNHK